MRLSEAWQGLPVLLRALAAGVLVVGTGLLPWDLLVRVNARVVESIPWTVPVMAAYLCLWWWYLRGRGWPRSTGEIRRRDLRGEIPPRRLWLWSLAAGGVGAGALWAITDLARRLSPQPERDLIPPERLAEYPPFTLLFLLLMTAAVSGVVEEAAFRGYMQAPLERRYGPWIAIFVVGAFSGLASFRMEASDVIPWLFFVPIYFAGAVIFGALACLSGSIRPGVICHTAFNTASLLCYWRYGVPKSVWETGFNAPFRAQCAVALVFVVATVLLFRRLADVEAEERRA